MANILLQWLVTGLLAVMHPFYVSVVDLNHNAREATVEVSIRAFAEDIEKVLQKYTTKKIDLLTPADKTFLESQIASYVSQKIKLKVNGQPVTMQYLGHEIQKESVWIYLEIPHVTSVSSLDIDCKLLYDYDPNQTNLVHAKSKGIDKNYKLDYPKNTASFSF